VVVVVGAYVCVFDFHTTERYELLFDPSFSSIVDEKWEAKREVVMIAAPCWL
jgi:hypothetical protein